MPSARLLSNERETPTTRRIRIALNGGAPFPYLAGQAAALRAGEGEPTPYSIASAPSETADHGWVEFLVKVDGSSRFGAKVSGLQPGVAVDISQPKGTFVLAGVNSGDRLIFVAGGTGIAPLRSMIRESIARGHQGGLALVYSARTPQEFAYLDELRGLAGAGRLNVTFTVTGAAEDWPHARGRAHLHLEDLVTPDATAFLCGPHAMVAELSDTLKTLGVRPGRVRSEDW